MHPIFYKNKLDNGSVKSTQKKFCPQPTFSTCVLCIVVLANYLIVLKGEILLKDYESLGIGRVIESLRRGKQMTQEDLAEKAGLEPNTISRIERDDVVPSYGSILSIALALNLTPIEFATKIEKHSKILDYYRQRNKEN